ncbi:MAG TPA: inositol monophosphatase family protein [Gaiellaceae bacterium]|nr:inositol monophosphatase family protein [Gaiellaceae bacterium]
MLSEAELDACAALAGELAGFAAGRIVAERPRADQIATKANAADWVTETDLAVERHVRATVLERFPGHRVVGEEYGESEAEGPRATWFVDPVDGTTNFVHGLPWSSFSLAVVDDAGPALGVVVDPYRREVLSAVRGRGALLDGEPVRCAQTETLTGGIVLTEMLAQSLWDGLPELIDGLAAAGCVTRIMGSNALSLASVGAGRATAKVLGSFGPIDCVAGMLIAREAGARVVPDGPLPAVGDRLVCVAPGVADALLSLLAGAGRGD